MRKGKIYQIFAWILVIAAAAVILASVGWTVVTRIGEGRLRKNATSKMPAIQQEAKNEDIQGMDPQPEQELEADESWPDDWIRYNGEVYDFNENILTFLCMGIDVYGEVSDKQTGLKSGQADAIFLLVLDPDQKKISIIAIDRNTMTDVDRYDEDCNYLGTMEAQVALAHGYGDGKELSARNTIKSVSRIMYDIPVHGYCAVNMAAIPAINDAVGGVEVTVLEDLSKQSSKLKKGENVLLKGSDAYIYVKYRDVKLEESARGRLSRQKQYLTAYIQKAKEAFKKDVTLPVTLFNNISKYMTTSVTVDEVAYLVGDIADYSFSQEDLIMIPGNTSTNGKYDEFYPDEEALKQMIVDVFYTLVKD